MLLLSAEFYKSAKNEIKQKLLFISSGANPEVKSFDQNKKMAKLALATNETYHNQKGEKVTETHWHNLILWGKQAEIAESYLKKGDEISIEGKLASRNYTDKEGIKRYVTEIVVNEILMLGGKK